ncbi:hypothetical protein HJG54_21170 [Leptolyngbya sp. NK1-12]|uniref:Filament integrity protein fraC n=1 Tax=Leptolyngbya sp. NK1-12 TaxID=2547451 RepID=A0AA97ARD1_9CYAN|nr:hypothetical protein HJG54_21170 [Leptolyngbya sp. NK1-12]
MVTDVFPFRAIVMQCLLLTVAIAVESTVLLQMLRTADDQPYAPRQCIQYAMVMNLLSTVLGWFTIFSFFSLATSLPSDWSRDLETALLNLIFFEPLAGPSRGFLVIAGFVTFFASFIVKQVGLWGFRWLLQSELPQISRESDTEKDKFSKDGIRELRKEPREDQLNINAVLFANAWSYSAILIILLIFAF